MSGYTNIFGGGTINPTLLSYAAFDINVDLLLVWPFASFDGAAVAADKMDITAETSGLSVFLPDASLVSVGQDLLFYNAGANTFAIKTNDGATLGTVASGQAWYFYLTDNSTVGGLWNIFQMGAGTSAANAGALAGAGLKAIVTTLNQNLPSTSLNADYAPGPNDRATVLRNTGGAVSWQFGDAAVLTNGWFIYAINNGTGNLTLLPSSGETIDGSANKVLTPSESCVIFSDGTNLWSLGFGRSISSTITGSTIDLTPGGTIDLTAPQILAQIQDLSGTLTSNAVVEYGTAAGYWFVWNNTSGAFSTTLRTNSLDAGAVVPQGNFSIVRSNGTNMEVAFTATTGTVTLINTTAGELVGGPITNTGTIGLANTAVTPGMYGDAATISQVTVDAKGRITLASAVTISIPITQVQTMSSAALLGRISDASGNGLAVFNNGPALVNPTVTTQTSSDNSTLAASTAFVQAVVAAAVAAALATAAASAWQSGDYKSTNQATEPAGWLFLSGLTIGNAASGATGRANADTASLFAEFWNNQPDSICPVSGGRGGSASADFAANKTIKMIDGRGRALVGRDDMGGTAASRITLSGCGIDGTILGNTGGEQTHILTVPEMPSHNHTAASQSFTGNFQFNNIPLNGGGGVTGNTGGDQPHNNVQPTLICNILVKL